MRRMRARISYGVAVVVLVTCFVCPVLEMFDHWDHTLQTGNDTEYTLVLLALCTGMVCALAQRIVALCRNSSATIATYIDSAIRNSTLFLMRPISLTATTESPPLFSLRI